MSHWFLISLKDGVRVLQINRPSVRNAFNVEMYKQFAEMLASDATDDAVRITIITGVGDCFSSGNDFSGIFSGKIDADFVSEQYEKFGELLINYPKVLIALVNGPAIGFAAAFLGLFDVVYASDRAIFSTPFVRFGICPDACSSYTFPRTMGKSKFSEMALLGKTITAQEAYECGLVAKVVPHENLSVFLNELLKFGELSLNALMNTKQLLMAPIKEQLLLTNKHEFATLRKIFSSPDIFETILKSFIDRGKL